MSFLFFLIGLFVGVFVTACFFAADKNLQRIGDDEFIAKKPKDGLQIIAVTPDVYSRLVMRKVKDLGTFEEIQARDLY